MTGIKAHKDPAMPPPLTVAEGPEWVEALTLLAPDMAHTLLAATRTLYP
ncbi:hypothetical protein [Ancylobacter dichloromethanicus]